MKIFKLINSIRFKIIILSILPPLLTIGTLTYLAATSLNETIQEEYIKKGKILNSYFISKLKAEADLSDKILMEHLIENLTELNPDIMNISLYTNEKGHPKKIVSSNELFKNSAVEYSDIIPIQTGKSHIHEEESNKLFGVVLPVIFQGKIIGSLEIHTSLKEKRELVWRKTFNLIRIGFIGFLLLTGTLYLLLNHFIFHPIAKLTRASHEIAKGNPHAEINYERKDEIGDLAKSVAQMNKTLKVRGDMYARELETVSLMNAIDQTILSSTELYEILDFSIKSLNIMLKVDMTSVIFLNNDGKSFKLIALTSNKETKISQGLTFQIKDSLPIQTAVAKREPVIFDDFQKIADRSPVTNELVKSGILSGMIIPLINKGKLLGTINFGKTVKDGFGTDDMILAIRIANQVAIAIDNITMYNHALVETEGLSAILKANEALGSTIYLDEVLDLIIKHVEKLVNAESVSVMLVSKEENFLETRATSNKDDKFGIGSKIKIGEGIAGWAFQKAEPLLIQDEADSEKFINYERHEDAITSSITIPLKAQDKLLGVLCVNSYTTDKVFTPEEMKFVQLYAAQAALAIESTSLFEELIYRTSELKRSNFDVIMALAEALETKDNYTGGHSQRMLYYADMLAQQLGLSEKETEVVKYATILHDIGKIGIPDFIINKPSRLSSDEFDVMKKHPQKGADILKKVSSLKEVVPIVYHHQEMWNGEGYPDGLNGETIPLGSRIVSVLDAYDAMTSDRAYRLAPGKSKAIAELIKFSGTQFDPNIVQAFLEILENEDNEFFNVEDTKSNAS